MPKKPDPLTPDELNELAARRAAARARARRLDVTADLDDDAIVAAAEADPDARPMTEAELASMRPAHEVHPGLVAASLRRRRGRPKLEAPKRQVTLRLDADVIERFKAQGPGWQTRINDVLRRELESS